MRPEVQPHPTCPVFDEFDPSAQYSHWAGVYALARDDRRNLAAIFTPQDTLLPGGALEPGECWEETLRPEQREERGFALHIHLHHGRATGHLELGGR